MNQQTKTVEEVCQLIKGRKPKLHKDPAKERQPYLVAKVLRGSQQPEYANIQDKNSVLVSKEEMFIIMDGSKSGELFWGYEGILSSTMGKLVVKEGIDHKYLRYFIHSTYDLFSGTKTGAAIPHLDKDVFYSLTLPVPTLSEQKKIVKILDEKFETIEKLKKVTEEQIKDAKELFESRLREIFLNNPDCTQTIGDIIQLSYGKPLPQSERESEGRYPAYGANGVKARTNKYYFDKPSIIVGRKGTAGALKISEEKFWPLDVTYFVEFNNKKHDLHYLFYMLLSLDLPQYATGVKPGINRNDVYRVCVNVPELENQCKIALKLRDLESKTKRISDLCEEKLAGLEELKKSYLEQAFAGKL